jgi:hypothetical protein
MPDSVNNLNYNLWSACENYLDTDDNHYSITSINRNKPVIYKCKSHESTTSKIIRISSYALIFPVLFSYIVNRVYRAKFSFNIKTLKDSHKVAHSDCDAIPSKDCRDTQEWRKKLISIAEHNIVISGNYCGGKAFDEILQAIDSRMSEAPNLKVVIISHPQFIQDNNKELLEKIQLEHGNRFSMVYSPNVFFNAKMTTNHTKCMVVDYGKYFIQGGSGIRDDFASSGLLDDSRNDSILIQNLKTNKKSEIFIESIIPDTFRDQDFIFQSKGESETGKRVYQEALFLALKWNQYHQHKTLSCETWDLDKLSEEDEIFTLYPVFSNTPLINSEKINTGKSALDTLLKDRIPKEIKTGSKTIQDFTCQKTANVKTKVFFTGPEDRHSDWEDNLIERIENARERIVIDHMYFQPSKRVMNALIQAASRKVDITVITVMPCKYSAISEKFFGHRNRFNAHYLLSSTKGDRKNVHIYKYDQGKNGLHKKIAVIDDEMNFEAQSREFADQTMEIINQDIKASKHLPQIQLSITNRIITALHNSGSFLWG